ncbi:hypothetical protein BGW38_010375 [Lunasporangiospora selenospora]|uniref:Uncharacterized protein n=1 Tax=Lunasporangiospora selenospora TaxID=979761 RepID=A0A9P6FX27_9FUNG|nr:hypothetical protein BGW38_010375 [Lunasporangiospora selenospora]
MDFFAQAYNRQPRAASPLPTETSLASHGRYASEGACQGYGTEANAHLRRASSGLESPSVKNTHYGRAGDYFSFTSTTAEPGNSPRSAMIASPPASRSSTTATSPTSMSPGGVQASSSPRWASPPATPQRRTSVSNPCLLHHTNSNGGGVVRAPVMPQSLGSPQIGVEQQSNVSSPTHRLHQHMHHQLSMTHEPAIAE